MHITTEDIVYLRTSSETSTMRRSHEDEPPPSYNDAITVDRLQSEITLHDEHFYGDQIESTASRGSTTPSRNKEIVGERPPQAKWLVKSSAEPSAWKLLTSGPLMTNATTPHNSSPLTKRRYRVLFPAGYEDVFLHKSSWSSNDASSLPDFHVELYSPTKFSDRYEPEAIVVLGPTDFISSRQTDSLIRSHLLAHLPKTFSLIESEVTKTTRLVTFTESEFFSWDWDCKTSAARHEMRMMIYRARKKVMNVAHLVRRLEKCVDFCGKKGDYQFEAALKFLRRSLRESGYRMGRLH
ncbi:hypothetical protein CERZMDRAFT_83308 [Cercospora zeae-maydis SCOH1-5]|uniref:Uncharacterized protein n=1 Tax=Cercospora zeae-maydis SCOH1-5 TaxID=717836 RepID=A0A6A6FK96_9PEZI|nr:hypothetical protein CERZMDRAFT_83308 [Cercospora zeae-maydis SCOH1-5]